MPDDDRLLDELADALRADEDPQAQPDPQRLAAFRRAVAALNADTAGDDGGASTAPTSAARRHRLVVPGWLTRPRLALGAALAAVALAIGGVLVGEAIDGSDSAAPAGVVEYAGAIQLPDGGDAGTLEIRAIGIGRTVDLRTDELPLLPRGDYYEVWFVGPGDTPARPNRISAGTFHPDRTGRSDVQLKAAADPALYPTVEITAEPSDGNPAATGPEVMRARVD
ncbi:anti-sigma factor [Conexibacter sp. CPCC 206217]|uniref:anti-sigma factor n=1 Tax=Conexibacter sp. CPCC 206217 TaxID=3064574 RepID=UPI00271CE682|nr:anti-sigma factor [Conexibacter sp. CPCC 206217]MDO8212026.1 anti-sigma factor [Conexibacter sp. CPCC 206217]